MILKVSKHSKREENERPGLALRTMQRRLTVGAKDLSSTFCSAIHFVVKRFLISTRIHYEEARKGVLQGRSAIR